MCFLGNEINARLTLGVGGGGVAVYRRLTATNAAQAWIFFLRRSVESHSLFVSRTANLGY
jgi:hypothetical protein